MLSLQFVLCFFVTLPLPLQFPALTHFAISLFSPLVLFKLLFSLGEGRGGEGFMKSVSESCAPRAANAGDYDPFKRAFRKNLSAAE